MIGPVRVIVLPRWMGRLLGVSVSLGGIVLAAEPTNPQLLAHEAVHAARQEALGHGRWLVRWMTSRAFRLQEEALAFAAEGWAEDSLEFQAFALALSSWRYGWAGSYFEAALALLEAMHGQD